MGVVRHLFIRREYWKGSLQRRWENSGRISRHMCVRLIEASGCIGRSEEFIMCLCVRVRLSWLYFRSSLRGGHMEGRVYLGKKFVPMRVIQTACACIRPACSLPIFMVFAFAG